MRARGNGTNGRGGRLDHVQVNAWRRYDVMKVAALRFGSRQLPDTDEGRRFLRVLIGLRLPASEAYATAPWCTAELPAIVDQVRDNPRPLHADAIGNAIEFAFEELKELTERRHYSITQVAPYDAQHGTRCRHTGKSADATPTATASNASGRPARLTRRQT